MNIALLLSGGTGTRLGLDIPKQYIEIGNRSIISYSIERLSMHYKIDAIQIVADLLWQKKITKELSIYDTKKKFKGFSVPGKNRQFSILQGLEDIRKYAKNTDYVLIHDAARPQLSEKMISDCLEAVSEHDGVIPALPMKDTLYSSIDGKRVFGLLNRREIFAGQAPEVFLLGKYYKANKRLLPEQILEINGSTEPAIMAGMDIIIIDGDEKNFKITTKADLERFQEIVNKGI